MAKAEYFDNAAGRLHSILLELRGRSASEKVVDAWAGVLKVEGGRNSLGSVLQEIAGVLELPARVREQLNRIAPEDAEDMLEHLPNIEKALSFSFYLENPLNEILSRFTDSDLVGLWYCSRELHRIAPEPWLPSSVLEELTQQLSELVEDLQSSDLPVDLKLFALRHLSAVRRAIEEFRIRGVEGLRVALLVAGTAFVSESRLQEEATKVGLWQRLIGFLTGAGGAIDSAAKIGKGTADILQLVTGETGGS